MMIRWRLSEILAERGIHNARQFHEALMDMTGVRISTQALHELMRRPPVQLRLETAQILCSFLEVPLDTYLCITPESIQRPPHGHVIKPYAQTPRRLIETDFTDPGRFFG